MRRPKRELRSSEGRLAYSQFVIEPLAPLNEDETFLALSKVCLAEFRSEDVEIAAQRIAAEIKKRRTAQSLMITSHFILSTRGGNQISRVTVERSGSSCIVNVDGKRTLHRAHDNIRWTMADNIKPWQLADAAHALDREADQCPS